ncbi:MAG: hypothetical protein ACRDZY_07650, partial [Acidimicrobiales bacterium]
MGREMRWHRLVVLGAVAGLAAASALVLSIPPATAVTSVAAGDATASSRVIPPDHLVSLGSPGVVLKVPTDGRLAGPGFYTQVVGRAEVHTGPSGIHAPSGMDLEIFALAVRSTPGPKSSSPLTGSVQAGRTELALPASALASPGTH